MHREETKSCYILSAVLLIMVFISLCGFCHFSSFLLYSLLLTAHPVSPTPLKGPTRPRRRPHHPQRVTSPLHRRAAFTLCQLFITPSSFRREHVFRLFSPIKSEEEKITVVTAPACIATATRLSHREAVCTALLHALHWLLSSSARTNACPS